MTDTSRYLRQMLLAEIGEDGQARLTRTSAALGGTGAAHDLASRYAIRAGLHSVVPGSIDVAELAPDFVHIPAARSALAGARAALLCLRHALGLSSPQ